MGPSFEHSCHAAFSGFCFESCLLWIGMSCLGCPSRSPWAWRKPVQARRPTGMFPAHPCFLPACQLWPQHHSAAKRLCSCRPGKWTSTLSLPLFPTLFSFKVYAKGAWNFGGFQKTFNYLIRVSEKRQFKNPSYCVRFLETRIKKKKLSIFQTPVLVTEKQGVELCLCVSLCIAQCPQGARPGLSHHSWTCLHLRGFSHWLRAAASAPGCRRWCIESR